MRFHQISWHNLANRPVRTLLTCLGVALGVASFIAMTGLSKGVETAWEKGLNEKGTHILAMKKGAAEILTATLDEQTGQQISSVDGVEDVSGELVDLVQVEAGTTVLLNGWPDQSSLWQTLKLVEGRLPKPGDKKSVVLGQSVAAALNIPVGGEITILYEKYTVRAIHQSGGALNNNSIIMPLSDMQALTGKDGRVTVFNIRVTAAQDPEAVSTVLARLENRFDGLMFQETSRIADNNKILNMFRTIAWGMSFMALIICSFVVLNTLLMSVTERRREIGIYLAVGWQPERVVMMITIEALMMSIAGAIIGLVSGVAGLKWLVGATELRAYIEPDIGLIVIGQTFLAAVILGIVSSVYPAWRAMQVSPTRALKYE